MNVAKIGLLATLIAVNVAFVLGWVRDARQRTVRPAPTWGDIVIGFFTDFLQFSQFPYWTVTPVPEPPNSRRVEAMDLRFGTPSAPAFVASAVVDGAGRVVESGFEFGKVRPH